MYIAIIVVLSVLSASLFCGLTYCIYRISKINKETPLDYSASDVETAHTTGWFGENM